MKVLITTNARLYKTPDLKYWTPFVYGYEFFKRYLTVFEEIKLVAHTENCDREKTVDMIRVDGPGISVYEVPFPHGKIGYIKMYNKIRYNLEGCFQDCDAAILRIPDQLAFQLYPYLRKNNIPVGVEVTSDSWDFFGPGSMKSIIRPILRVIWHFKQKFLCGTALGTAYVTKVALQKRYPPLRAYKKTGFTTNYTDTDIDEKFLCSPRDYKKKINIYTAIHVSGNIGGLAKGHKELITAIGMLSERGIDLNLVLVGGGSLDPSVDTIIDKYNIRSKIRFTGLLTNNKDLRAELVNADIFVFPSYREGLPRVLVEAMACALPCVATELSGIKELLDDNCLVPVKNSVALMNKIEDVIKNTKNLNNLSKKNVDKAAEYSIENMGVKRTEFYKKIKDAVNDRICLGVKG